MLYSLRERIVDDETKLSCTCFVKYVVRDQDQSVADAYGHHKDVDPLRIRKYYKNPNKDGGISINLNFRIFKIHTSSWISKDLSKLISRQTSRRTNFPDELRKSFSRLLIE